MRRKPTDLLLIEDDPRIRLEVLEALRADGFAVDVAATAKAAAPMLQRDYALALVDLGLPDGNGIDLIHEVRRSGRSLPILVLTARDAAEDRVRGLDSGADDYLVKPFHMPELLARVRSLLRRSGRHLKGGPMEYGPFWLDPDSRAAKSRGLDVTLKPREFDLLLFLIGHPGRTWTRDQLLDQVWGPEFQGDARTVDLHVRRLRAKVEEDPADPRYMQPSGVWATACES